MSKQPVDYMFSPYRRRLLAVLLLRPDERFHVRELERMTRISAGSLHRELNAMATAGLLLREKVGNQVFYQADARCTIYPELAAIFRKTAGMAYILRDALAGLAGKIQVAFVFGSMASGKQRNTSDLDFCIVGDASLLEVVKALHPTQAMLGREINPVVLTARKFVAQRRERNVFVLRLLKEPKVFVVGDEGELGKLVANRKARNP